MKRYCYRSFWEECRLFIFPLMSDLVLADGYLLKFASSFLFTITDKSVVMLYFEFVLQQYVTGYNDLHLSFPCMNWCYKYSLLCFFNYMLLTSFPVKSDYSSIDKKNSFFIHRIIFQIIYFCKKLFFILLTLTTLFFYFWI